jgi:amino-acid N-acetyltransferase
MALPEMNRRGPSPPILPSSEIQFVHWFRSAAPYIHGFRGQIFVIAFGGEVVAGGGFVDLTHDLNLLASLGVKLVLVHGARPQIEALLESRGQRPSYVNGIRVTDDSALACVKEANGALRVQIEAALSMGLPNTPMANAAIRVASGNFVTARPRGVVEGIDLLYSGEVRRIDVEAIRRRLDCGDIVLVSPLGYSPTGEVFNLTLDDVAHACAAALRADKLILLLDEPGVTGEDGQLMRELTVSQAQALLQGSNASGIEPWLAGAIRACGAGVARIHLISRHIDGALLLELFTHQGIGTMLTRDALENLRRATIDDVGGILQLISPLEAVGVLVKRSRELLEREIERFFVLEHDRMIVGCAALYPFADERAAELACLAVQPAYRGSGAGDHLLRYTEAQARALGIEKLFVLTTSAAHWFIERGFKETGLESLPAERKMLYNYQRRSKVLVTSL